MLKKKICLFSAMPPRGGGGSVSLRSMIANMPDVDISWQYVTEKVAVGYEDGYMGPGFMGGPVKEDIYETWRMLTDRPSQKINKIVEHLLSIECDGYWIVSYNEGLRVALELTRRQKQRPVHMSVHDDWAGAICGRSMRYRFMAGPAKKMTVLTLKSVTSFDATSRGMRDYYKQLSGRDSGVTHRYITAQSVTSTPEYKSHDTEKITVGHIGSLYVKADFFKFLSLLFEYARLKNKQPEVHLWGCHLNAAEIPVSFRDNVHFHDTLPEKKVIPELARCRLVYAMYPMSKRFGIFSKTSMQTKLASYIQARRPVFGQGPADSSLAEYLDTTELGKLWDAENKAQGMDILDALMDLHPTLAQLQYAREQYFGEHNIEVVRNGILNCSYESPFIL